MRGDLLVIPGQPARAELGIHNPRQRLLEKDLARVLMTMSCGYGFRARAKEARPGMTARRGATGLMAALALMFGSLIAAAMVAASSPAAAQDATWLASPSSGDFNTGANWSTATVPTGTAFFGTSSTTSLSFSQDTTVGGWTFNAGASNYTFTNDNVLLFSNGYVLTFSGAGIVVNGGSAAITNANGVLNFYGTSTAGSAAITNTIGVLNFYGTSTDRKSVV